MSFSLLAVIAGLVITGASTPPVDDASLIIAAERAALARWGNGDPDGFLELSDPDVVYFDPFVQRRLDGRENLRKLYETLRGKVKIDRFEMVDPKVRIAGDMAVLTYNFTSHGPDGTFHWNTTEVFEKREGKWRIIHTHWSFTQPKLAR